MTALLAGALIAAVALAFVLWPLFAGSSSARSPRRAVTPVARDDSAVRALREIEFDRHTGKLSDADYAALKADYTARALAELRRAEAPSAVNAATDAVEEMVRTARGAVITCHQCNTVRPEPDAVYCSSCGAYLPGRCGNCGTAVTDPGAKFCTSCGWSLAA